MKEDITKNALAILLVCAIIISVLSTFAVLNSIKEPVPVYQHGSASGNGQGSVGLVIEQSTEPEFAQGTVSLTIKAGDTE